jgi:hypothetical protein
MLPMPADIFTEPDNVSPDGLANLGPLRHLAITVIVHLMRSTLAEREIAELNAPSP